MRRNALLRNFSNLGWAGLLVFNIKMSNFGKCKSSFTPKSEINQPQAEGKVNSRLYVNRRVQHSSAIKNKLSTNGSLSQLLFAY